MYTIKICLHFFIFPLSIHCTSISYPKNSLCAFIISFIRFSRWRILSFSFSFFWIGSSDGFFFFSPLPPSTPRLVASRIDIVVPLGGIEPGFLAVKVWNSKQWTAREFPCGLFLKNILTAYRILVWQLFSFSTLKKLFLVFLASVIIVRK